MSVEDVISEAKVRLEELIAPINGGVGADVTYDETFDLVKNEIEKLQSLAGGKVDWHAIATNSAEILTDKGKDFRVALYYAAACAQTGGLVGLLDGFLLLQELDAAFWDKMGPPLKRPKARGNLCSWFSDFTAPVFVPYQPTAKDLDIITAINQ